MICRLCAGTGEVYEIPCNLCGGTGEITLERYIDMEANDEYRD
jgi:DnaJ-class molecular chaperone